MKKISLLLLLTVLCVSLAACGKEKKKESEETEETSEEVSAAKGSTYPGAVSVTVPQSGDREWFGIMHGYILDVQTDDGKHPVLTIRDDEDPENAWTVDTAFVKDVAFTPEKGGRAALFFYGDIEKDPDAVEMIAAWNDGRYEIRTADGTIAESTVDDFLLEEGIAEGRQRVRFVKNNCLTEKEAAGVPEGLSVRVVYVDSGEAVKYPLKIYSNTEGE